MHSVQCILRNNLKQAGRAELQLNPKVRLWTYYHDSDCKIGKHISCKKIILKPLKEKSYHMWEKQVQGNRVNSNLPIKSNFIIWNCVDNNLLTNNFFDENLITNNFLDDNFITNYFLSGELIPLDFWCGCFQVSDRFTQIKSWGEYKVLTGHRVKHLYWGEI